MTIVTSEWKKCEYSDKHFLLDWDNHIWVCSVAPTSTTRNTNSVKLKANITRNGQTLIDDNSLFWRKSDGMALEEFKESHMKRLKNFVESLLYNS